MKRVRIKNFGSELSSVCLGTANFGEDRVPEKLAFRLLDVWKDLGGKVVDTANVYGSWVDGSNLGEKIIGKWLSDRGRHDITVATKCCHWGADDPGKPRVNMACARADIELSLRTLGLDYLEICWLHRDDPTMPVEEIVGFCEDLRKNGLIAAYGFSNWSADRINLAYEHCQKMGYSGLVGVQNGHSASVMSKEAAEKGDPTMLYYSPGQGDFHRSSGIAEFPYSAIGNGVFCIMDAAGVEAEEGRLISVKNEDMISEDFAARWFSERNLKRYSLVKNYCRESGISVFDACVAFHTARDYIDIPVIATTRESRLLSLALGADAVMPVDLIRRIESI
ncbi:MAG: aldo/keto reductase [Clostridia bacterium]|nr:aldo/keto reductase [Clostridia bacterium]